MFLRPNDLFVRSHILSETLEINYQYKYASAVRQSNGTKSLELATFGGEQECPHFFSGHFLNPKRAADMLLLISTISRTRFFSPGELKRRMVAAADPVVTSDGSQLRFEVFSLCCGMYARFDLAGTGLDGAFFSKGTTNVDFNAPMRAALQTVTEGDIVGLSVGADAVELHHAGSKVVEKKVNLPERWLKGFIEVQIYQSNLKPVLTMSGQELANILRDLPAQGLTTPGNRTFLSRAEQRIRISHRSENGAVGIGAMSRLKLLQPILHHASNLTFYSTNDEVSAVQLHFDEGNLHVVLSPDASRGFSGEGQALRSLTSVVKASQLAMVRSALSWGTGAEIEELCSRFAMTRDEVLAILNALGARGLVGYDTFKKCYFHRQLPFDATQIEQLHPRMTKARKIENTSGVQVITNTELLREARVVSARSSHLVQLPEKGEPRCTCHWQFKHEGKRGACTHILAAELAFRNLGNNEYG
jgi:hypothetical protein